MNKEEAIRRGVVLPLARRIGVSIIIALTVYIGFNPISPLGLFDDGRGFDAECRSALPQPTP